MNQTNPSDEDLTWDELHEIAANPMVKIEQRFVAYEQMLLNHGWYFEFTNDYIEWLKGRGRHLQLRELRADLAKTDAKQASELYAKHCPWK
jgi:hypothetical protein